MTKWLFIQGMVTQICNVSTWEAETGRLGQIQGPFIHAACFRITRTTTQWNLVSKLRKGAKISLAIYEPVLFPLPLEKSSLAHFCPNSFLGVSGFHTVNLNSWGWGGRGQPAGVSSPLPPRRPGKELTKVAAEPPTDVLVIFCTSLL